MKNIFTLSYKLDSIAHESVILSVHGKAFVNWLLKKITTQNFSFKVADHEFHEVRIIIKN